MTAPALIEVAADPMTAVRALNRMRRAGITLELDTTTLVVSPADRLTEEQRRFIHAHKPALVQLLNDAETLYDALQAAGAGGLDWQEGTPAEWTDARLLAAGEVLYADGRMVNRNDRRYLKKHAPPPPPESTPDPENVIPIDREAYEERAAIMEYDGGLPRDEAERKALALAIRAQELNAKARVESEALPGWEVVP